jgi:hypothetical protein
MSRRLREVEEPIMTVTHHTTRSSAEERKIPYLGSKSEMDRSITMAPLHLYRRQLLMLLLLLLPLVAVPAAPSDNGVHAIIMTPEEGAVVVPGTDVLVAYRVSEYFLQLPGRKGACLLVNARGPSDPPRPPGAPPDAQTCVEGTDTFAVAPSEEGAYELTVQLWHGDPDHHHDAADAAAAADAAGEVGGLLALTSSAARFLEVRRGAALDAAAYARREGFRMIYEYGHWGEEGGRSGGGSSQAAARSDRFFLADFIRRHHVRSLFDAGCGAMEWQPSLLFDLEGTAAAASSQAGQQQLPPPPPPQRGLAIEYHGADIVPEVVAANREKFAGRNGLPIAGAAGSPSPPAAAARNWTFSERDLVNEAVPSASGGRPFDAVLCRHALFHNSNDAVRAIVANVARSGARFFVATTLRSSSLPPPASSSSSSSSSSASSFGALPAPPSTIVNSAARIGTDGRKLALGGYRPVELEAPPFSLPPPLLFHPEHGADGKPVVEEGRAQGLAVWAVDALAPFR